jgi:hypothetical protein
MTQHQAPNGYDFSDPVISRLAHEAPDLLTKIRQDWLRQEHGIIQMYPEQRSLGKVCEIVPRDLSSYIRHVVEMVAAEDAAVARWGRLQELYSRSQYPPWQLPLAFGGRQFGDTLSPEFAMDMINDQHPNHPLRGSVLAQLTIWQSWAPPFCVPWRPYVGWPAYDEMSWEGDQRVASENGRYGRFPALPRRSDYDSYIQWQQRAYVKPWTFDDVWPTPQMDNTHLPVEQPPPEVVPQLLNQSLLAAINSDDIPVPMEKIRARVAAIRRQT